MPYIVRLAIAYLLLLTGGVFGLHHFYLMNYFRLGLYAFSGGVCGLGVILDFFIMPYLVLTSRDFFDPTV